MRNKRMFNIAAEFGLTRKPDWIDNFRKKYDKPYHCHITLRTNSYFDYKNFKKLTANLNDVTRKYKKIKVTFDKLLIAPGTRGECIMIKAVKNKEIYSLHREIANKFSKYGPHITTLHEKFDKKFIPHLTIARHLTAEQLKNAKKELKPDLLCTGVITELVLTTVKNDCFEEWGDPKNKLHYKLQNKWEQESIKVAKYYRGKIEEHGLTRKVLGERAEIKDSKFFNGLFENLNIGNNLSVLDIGSGLGDLIPYLKQDKKITLTDYLGIDLVKKFVNYAKEKHPQYKFQVANFISDTFHPGKKYDLVVALGVLVSRVSDYDKFIEYFITKALKFTKKFFVFNLIIKIDRSSPNYKNQKKIGGITSIPEKNLINIINKLNNVNQFKYYISTKKIYGDATEAFVRIII